MHRIFITALLLTSIETTMAMQKTRTIICNKPLISMATTAATTSLLTWSVIHSKELQHSYHNAKKQQIRKALAAEYAQMSLTFSDR